MFHPMHALKSSKGYTLIELMMVVVIIGLLASLAIPKYEGYIEKARIARAIAEIRYFERDITAYYVEHEQYPNTLADLGRSLNNMLDPWGNPYQYFLIAGTKWVSNDGGGGKYYARSRWTPGMVTAAAGSGGGFWSGSWFVSEAWADQPADPGNSGSPPGQGGTPPGQGGTPPGQGGTPPGQGGTPPGGGGGGNDVQKKPRQDRFLKPVTSDYDLYSMGPDGQTTENLNAKVSRDDIIRASEGAYVGVAEYF